MEYKKLKKLKTLKTLGTWTTRTEVMEFFNYKPTQIHQFMKDFKYVLIVSRIGRRCFIQVKSIERVLDMHQESAAR